ncbi:hypothetical protein Mal4_04500 [Maioricimonas rarisocia]|uniref:Uncharacterized protein n=1 Tax=Maioricimonas rarisocia TaxID=2528026 RepID=A0A517Z111_9PLAN|nr:hypothetical protein [Maioricimonas rarisocia]QDU36167.1 hypothetical protein Mal4_04500 [Maioricimonas rarisocia]
MTISSTGMQAAVEIDWYAEEDRVEVIPRDQQRFDLQKDRVINLLQLADHGEKQLLLLLRQLGEWFDRNSGRIPAAYLTLRDNTLLFLVISETPACDDELEDELSDLDLAIANDPDLKLIRLNTLVLPPASPEALGSFFHDEFTLVFRGKRTGSH